MATTSSEYRDRLKRLLDRTFQRAQIGMPYDMSAMEVQALAQFLVELTAQNADLAARLKAALEYVPEELKGESVDGGWSPFA